MKSTAGLLLLATAGLFVAPLIGKAQTTDGAFVNGSVGNRSLDSGPVDDHDTSYGVNAGYRWAISPETLIGVEAGYVDLGTYSTRISIVTTPLSPIGTPPGEPVISPGIASTGMTAWSIGANGRYSLSPNWHVSARAGLLRASIETRVRTTEPGDSIELSRYDVNADGWYAGAGIGYDFSNNLSLGLNYDYYRTRKSGFTFDPTAISLSGEYRF
jgi:OmpA-OmpF porin, OOP family